MIVTKFSVYVKGTKIEVATSQDLQAGKGVRVGMRNEDEIGTSCCLKGKRYR